MSHRTAAQPPPRRWRAFATAVATVGLIAGFLAFSAVPAAAAGVTFWVDPAAAASSPGTGCGANAAFTTPGAAITAAGANDIVEICPGTYVGDVLVPGGKAGLNIRGAKAGIAPTGPTLPVTRGTGESIIEGTVNITGNSAGVTVDGLWVESGAVHGLRLQALAANTTFRNNVVRGTPGTPGGATTQNGIFMGTMNGATVTANNITGYRYGIHTTTQATNAASTISNNYIAGSGVSSIQVGSTAVDMSISGNLINTGATGIVIPIGPVSVTGNTIQNLAGPAIFLATNGVRSGTVITGNTFANNNGGINNQSVLPDGGTPTLVNDNNISGNTYGIAGANPLNAECNWWGSAKGARTSPTAPPGAGDQVSANVDFRPWRIAPAPGGACTGDTLAPTAAGTGTPNPGFDPYVVDFDGTASTDVDGTIVQWDWDFGDSGTGTGATTSHSYPGPGTYTVTLTVTDNNTGGLTDDFTFDVTVGPAPNQIRGTVTSETDSSPVVGLQVRLFRVGETTSSARTTDAQGRYSFSGIAPGDYELWFRDVSNRSWFSEYYDEAATRAEATPITVTSGGQVVIDEQLVPRVPPVPNTAVISGTVTQADGITPISGIQVRLYPGPAFTTSAATTTDANGQYSFVNRAPGNYKLWFRDISNVNFVSEYHQDQASLEAADEVTATNGNTTTVNASLAAAGGPAPTTGSITGTVTQADGVTPIPGIQIRVYREGFSGSFATFTDVDGNYSVPNRPAGTYRIWFRDISQASWVSEYYDDQPSLEAATPIVLGPGDSTVADASLDAVT